MEIIYKKAERKTVKIEVRLDGAVVVYYPKYCPKERAEAFVREKSLWIDRKRDEILKNRARNDDIFELNTILLLGKRVVLMYEKGVVNPVLTEKALLMPIDAEKSPEKKREYLKKYIKNAANDILPHCVSLFTKKIGKCPTKIIILQQKSVWGSCNTKKEIRLNAKLVMLPRDLMEYVVIHELCHMIELNHSQKFWQNVNLFCDSAKCRKNLKQYNYLISLF